MELDLIGAFPSRWKHFIVLNWDNQSRNKKFKHLWRRIVMSITWKLEKRENPESLKLKIAGKRRYRRKSVSMLSNGLHVLRFKC